MPVVISAERSACIVIPAEALAEWRKLVVSVFAWLVRFLDFSLAAFARNDWSGLWRQ